MRSVTTDGQAIEAEPELLDLNAEGFNGWLLGQLRARKMSQRQLAQKAGVDHSSISRLIRGDRVPSLRTAMRLARVIDGADHDATNFRPPAAPTGANPTARVEYALRADAYLTESDVRDIMLYYLAVRRGGSRPVTASRSKAGINVLVNAPVTVVARATAAPVRSKPSNGRDATRRS